MTALYTLPLPPAVDHSDHGYYQAFVHQMNRLPEGLSITVRLRQAIDNTANFMESSPAHVARLLVDYGLRAPRQAFPESFLDFVDRCPAPRLSYERAVLANAALALKEFWQNLTPSNATIITEERVYAAM